MKNAQVVIVKKRRHAPHGHHGGAWKVAYTDFVTAMMAFFLVMWIVGQSPELKRAVAHYFNNPGIFDNTSGNSILQGGNKGVDPEGPAKPEQQVSGLAERDKKALEKTQAKITEALMAMPDVKEAPATSHPAGRNVRSHGEQARRRAAHVRHEAADC